MKYLLFINNLKRIIRNIFSHLGYELKKKGATPVRKWNQAMIEGLSRCQSIGVEGHTIVDVGAAEGLWSLAAKDIWKNSSFVLFEPLLERFNSLTAVAAMNPKFHFVPKAAGKEKSAIQFYIADDLDGSGVADKKTNQVTRTVEVSSIDIEVKQRELTGPYIIKLDTHGFEVPIIEGCTEILEKISLFIIECYGFQIADNSLVFWEMCQFMETKGFRLYDIVDVMHRRKDGAFWQCDAFFIRKDHTLFKDNRYQ